MDELHVMNKSSLQSKYVLFLKRHRAELANEAFRECGVEGSDFNNVTP